MDLKFTVDAKFESKKMYHKFFLEYLISDCVRGFMWLFTQTWDQIINHIG